VLYFVPFFKVLYVFANCLFAVFIKCYFPGAVFDLVSNTDVRCMFKL